MLINAKLEKNVQELVVYDPDRDGGIHRYGEDMEIVCTTLKLERFYG